MTEDKYKSTAREPQSRTKCLATDMPPAASLGTGEGERRGDAGTASASDDSGASLYAAIRAWVEPFGGIELTLPPRELMRDPPDFGE